MADITALRLLSVRENLPAFVELDEAAARKELEMTLETAAPVERPMLYQVETTSRCNLVCDFCPRTTSLMQTQVRDLNADMTLDRFEALLDAMPWLESLELFHFGEPFMQAGFDRYIQACTDRNIFSVVASNLLPATPTKLDAAFAAGLDFLVMDIDSLDESRYAEMRKGAGISGLGKLRQRVRYILSHPQRPYTVAQTIMLNDQPEYTEAELLKWTGGLCPDEVRYKFLDAFRGEVTTPKEGMRAGDLCREPFYGFTVHVNGNVVPCDRDWAGEHVMGNVFEQTIDEIWHGEPYARFRAQMKSADKPDICKTCPEGRLINMRSQRNVQVNMFKGSEIEHE